jgi:hypothetical protein
MRLAGRDAFAHRRIVAVFQFRSSFFEWNVS